MAAAIEQQGQVADITGVTERTRQQAGRCNEISQALHQLAESQRGLVRRALKGWHHLAATYKNLAVSNKRRAAEGD